VIVVAVVLVLIGVAALAVLASVVPFGWAGVLLLALFAIVAIASPGGPR
jgi:hypothetical protein